MSGRHYSLNCGCKYTEGNPNPWLVCVDHFSSGKTELAKHYWLYALLLKDNKYYVGITARKNPYDRINSHGSFLGARWTMAHPPEKVLEINDLGFITQTEAETKENTLTLNYMKKYGYKNVRGGNVTYSGNIYKLGNKYIRGNQVEYFLTAILMFVIAYYLIFVANP